LIKISTFVRLLILTTWCCAECSYATVCRPSICSVQVPWTSHRLEYFDNNFTTE